MGIKKIPFFDFSAVLDKLQAIADNVHPTASGTSITPTGMHIVTEDDAQGALAELDAECYSLSNSLTQLITIESFDMGTQTISAGARGIYTKDISKSGYTPLGIVDIALSNNYFYVGSYTVNNNSAQVVVHNGTTQASQTVYIKVLYKKN